MRYPQTLSAPHKGIHPNSMQNRHALLATAELFVAFQKAA